ncbi:MAG: hypothetical protein JRI58_06060 [Deltaproteobacteria bacterium]|nr:hypothetical protein [Deltaproteobacteria bacterium]MBW2074299.1 hypothetical protein [Deltaproteobacteria bacterium]RLB82879.1 MAG: hypothetical protein DRH17_04445 [Deltaproteobacteria bacterium]
MKKKQKPFNLEPVVEFMTNRFKIPTKKEIDKLIKKTEQSLESLKVPTRAAFDQLTKRVEALEKALKAQKRATKVAGPAKVHKKAGVKKRPVSKAKPQMTDSEKVLAAMKKYPAGVDVATLKTITGFEDKKIRNIVFRLSKKRKVKRTGRGVYKAIA